MSAKAKFAKKHILHIDEKIIAFFRRSYIPLARVALALVFFWFGLIKLAGLSPAGDLAAALTVKTVGLGYFDLLFKALAFLECLIGFLFLFPKLVRVVMPLLFAHMAIVCAPLIMVPELTWQATFVPTLEGQYIIKNIVIVALAFGVAAHTQPLAKKSA